MSIMIDSKEVVQKVLRALEDCEIISFGIERPKVETFSNHEGAKAFKAGDELHITLHLRLSKGS